MNWDKWRVRAKTQIDASRLAIYMHNTPSTRSLSGDIYPPDYPTAEQLASVTGVPRIPSYPSDLTPCLDKQARCALGGKHSYGSCLGFDVSMLTY